MPFAVPSWSVLLLTLAPLLGGCAQPAQPLQVMTFNVRYANPDDGPDAWPLRSALVFDLIRAQAPDLVGLQEALPEQMDELRAAWDRAHESASRSKRS